jgi:hypothetical protein
VIKNIKSIFLIKVIRNRTIISRIAAIANTFNENIFHINGGADKYLIYPLLSWG